MFTDIIRISPMGAGKSTPRELLAQALGRPRRIYFSSSRSRRNGAPPPWESDLNARFVMHHSNHDLAIIVACTKDRTPEQTRDEILLAVKPRQRVDVP